MQNISTTTTLEGLEAIAAAAVAKLRADRVTDGMGREWAVKTNGDWACLGHAISVDSIDELDARYTVTAVA